MLDLRKSDVFLDVCTQRDYLAENGARRGANAPQVLSNLKHVMAFARWARVPTLSCVDVRRLDEVRGMSNPGCVVGTPGQRKVGFSLLPQRVVFESDNCLSVPLDILQHYQQAIFTKAHRDPFTNPKLDRLLTEMPSGRFVVFGVALELSIRLLVLGLLLRGRKVTLVEDACAFWNHNEADMALRQLRAKGCDVVSTYSFIRSAFEQRHVEFRPRPERRFVA